MQATGYTPVGRKKKENSIKRTYRMDKLILKMVELYGNDRSMDSTTALNHIAFEYLSTFGYRKKAEDAIAEALIDESDGTPDDASPIEPTTTTPTTSTPSAADDDANGDD
jgi:hypothetical protein